MNEIENIKRKMYLMISRGGLTEVDNDTSEIQKIQTVILKGEVISDIERYQEYGFETYPIIASAESVNLHINGNRNANRTISICVNNRKYRPDDLASGDVCIYRGDSNNTNKNRIWFKGTDNTIHISTYDKKEVIIDTNKIEIKDNDGNDSIWDTNGIKHTDKNSNIIEMKNTGIEIVDGVNLGNKITMDSNGIKLEDLNGNTFEMVIGKVKINGTNEEILQ